MTGRNAQDGTLSRWSVLAAAMLIALVGLLSGAVRDGQLERAVHSSDKSDGQQISRREPVRALVVAERKDGGASHWQGIDGALAVFRSDACLPKFKLAVSSIAGVAANTATFWPVPLPRAPPAAMPMDRA